MAGTDALDSLRAIPLFSHVADGDLEQIASHLIERRYPRNTTIVEEGLPGDYMYIIREGRVKVTKLSEDGREKILAFFDPGHFVGDMALLDRAPRSASVKALTPVRVLALSRADFTGLIRKSPDLAIAVIRELSGRLRAVNDQASALSFQRVKDRTKGLLVRLAKALNRAWERRGRVIGDRYHALVLKTPRAVRHALVYAVQNARKHGAQILGIDAYSSGPWFEGWADRAPRPDRSLPRPDSWLLSFGWTKGGLISTHESPRGGAEWDPGCL